MESYRFSPKCSLCKSGVSELDKLFTSQNATQAIEELAVMICAKYVVENSTVCSGAVKEMGDIILPVLASSLLDPEFFCTEFLGYCSTSYYMFYAE